MYLRNKKTGHYRSLAASCTVLIVAGLWLAGLAGAQQSHPAEPHRHPEAQKIKNPVPSDAASVEEGKKLYQRYCASCHGPGGKGDGSLALAGGTPSDLTDEVWDHGSSDGEIFVVTRDGVTADMLGYKDRLTEKQIWHIVNFLRSIGPKPEKEDKFWGGR
jgi:mono/diheme cytochrome c family protein